jgi:hypothetical protein
MRKSGQVRSASKHIAAARDRALEPCLRLFQVRKTSDRGRPTIAPRQLYDSSLVKPHNSKRRRDAWLDHDHCLDARDVIRVEVRGYSGHEFRGFGSMADKIHRRPHAARERLRA